MDYVHKLNISIDQSYIKNNISSYSERDISFINNVCMNTMRYVFHCNKIVNLYTKKTPGLNERFLFSSAITQIVFLNFKNYAVINSTVEVAKKIKVYHSFINAVLKKISLDKDRLTKIKPSYDDLPKWFSNYSKNLSTQEKKNFLKNYFEEPDLHIVFKSQNYLNSFEDEIIVTSKLSGFLKNKMKISNVKSYDKGYWWVQDFSSAFSINFLEDEIINKKCIDLCAAPGGKSFQILSKNKNITLNDKNAERIRLLKLNMNRLNFDAKIINEDILNFNERERYGFVILDAPCSAIGTIRKNPEIFFKSKKPDIKELVKLQKKMLDKAAVITERNGLILYMVCSFLEVETTNQLKDFLKRNKNFSIYKFCAKGRPLHYNILVKNNYMYTLPTKIKNFNIDGYFAVYLKKNK